MSAESYDFSRLPPFGIKHSQSSAGNYDFSLSTFVQKKNVLAHGSSQNSN